jgi:hypothetical protein
MLKFKRETSGTSAIIWLITEHTATDHSERFFLGTSSWTMGPAQGVQMTDLTKFNHLESFIWTKNKNILIKENSTIIYLFM